MLQRAASLLHRLPVLWPPSWSKLGTGRARVRGRDHMGHTDRAGIATRTAAGEGAGLLQVSMPLPASRWLENMMKSLCVAAVLP